MTTDQFKELLDRYLTDNLTPEESQAFAAALATPAFAAMLEKEMESSFMEDIYLLPENEERKKRLDMLMEEKLQQDQQRPASSPGKMRRLSRWMAAAVLLFVIAGASIIYFSNQAKPTQPSGNAVVAKQQDILPGHEGAVLRLSDGTSLVLDSAGNGTLASQGHMQVVKENGRIFYKGSNTDVLYNHIMTDKGRQWSVTLPDGTLVWLNASSSIDYPLTFGPTDRVVTITGEAYFEVAPDKAHPFKVKTAGQEVTVLGTHFNINGYTDEEGIRTTLLEGSVRISSSTDRQLLTPGQQALLVPGEGKISISKADVQQAIAWKNGYFSFHDADIKTVMRQLSRWYDIEVVYGKNLPPFEFEGAIDRSLPLSGVLRILEKTRVKFTVDQNKLFIMP